MIFMLRHTLEFYPGVDEEGDRFWRGGGQGIYGLFLPIAKRSFASAFSRHQVLNCSFHLHLGALSATQPQNSPRCR